MSLAKKHQASIAYKWETCPFNNVEYGPLKLFNVEDEEMITQGLPAAEDTFSANWVIMNGTEYRAGLVICCGSKHDMPVFCSIKKIVLVNSVTFFLVNKLFVESSMSIAMPIKSLKPMKTMLLEQILLKFTSPLTYKVLMAMTMDFTLCHYFICKSTMFRWCLECIKIVM